MKKSMLLLSFCMPVITAFTQVKDSILIESPANDTWQNNTLQILSYNTACAFSNSLSKTWNAGTQTWTNTSQEHFTYDNNGNLTTYLSQRWNTLTDAWVNSFRSITSRPDATTTVTIQQSWDTLTASWVNTYKSTDKRDNSSNLVRSVTQVYKDNAWQNFTFTSLDFDTQNRITATRSAVWQVNAWVNSSSSIYSYNTDNNGISINYYWNDINKVWVKAGRDVSDYLNNTNKPESVLSQTFSGTEWTNNFRSRYSYELYNNIYQQTAGLSRSWDPGTLKWVNVFQDQTGYYDDGSRSSYQFEIWDASIKAWVALYRNSYTHNNTCILSGRTIQENKKTNNSLQPAMLKMTRPDAPILHSDLIIPAQQKANNLHQYVFRLTLEAKAGNKKMAAPLIVSAATSTKSFTIAPNPAKNYFNISIATTKEPNQPLLKITDITGRVILQQKLQNTATQQVSLPASLAKGIYLVTVNTGTKSESKKLVVE